MRLRGCDNTVPSEVVRFLSFGLAGVYAPKHSPSGSVGLSGPERVIRFEDASIINTTAAAASCRNSGHVSQTLYRWFKSSTSPDLDGGEKGLEATL